MSISLSSHNWPTESMAHVNSGTQRTLRIIVRRRPPVASRYTTGKSPMTEHGLSTPSAPYIESKQGRVLTSRLRSVTTCHTQPLSTMREREVPATSRADRAPPLGIDAERLAAAGSAAHMRAALGPDRMRKRRPTRRRVQRRYMRWARRLAREKESRQSRATVHNGWHPRCNQPATMRAPREPHESGRRARWAAIRSRTVPIAAQALHARRADSKVGMTCVAPPQAESAGSAVHRRYHRRINGEKGMRATRDAQADSRAASGMWR